MTSECSLPICIAPDGSYKEGKATASVAIVVPDIHPNDKEEECKNRIGKIM